MTTPATPPTVDRSRADAAAKRPAPITLKDRITGALTGVVIAGLGVAMIIRPDLRIDSDDMSGRRGRGLAWLLDLVWSMPAGIVLAGLGALVLAGALLRGRGVAADRA